MKIGFVTGAISRKAGGLHESVRRLAQCIQAAGWQVPVFGREDEDAATDLERWKGMEVSLFPVRGPKSFAYCSGLRMALDGSGCDAVHVHGIWQYPSVVSLDWHRRKGRPHIVSPRGMLDGWALRRSRWRKRLAGRLYERAHLETAACVHALCGAEADAIRDYGLRNPICVIPNGVDFPNGAQLEGCGKAYGAGERVESGEPSETGEPVLIPSEWQVGRDGGSRSRFGLADAAGLYGKKVLLFLGRIHSKKGLEELVRAWARLHAPRHCSRDPHAREWVLAIAGWDQDGHEALLKDLATELAIPWLDAKWCLPGARVHGARPASLTQTPADRATLLFLGPQFGSSKTSWFDRCDAFILPSLSEGLPMAVLEAWAHSKPVLMTPQCNLTEGFVAGAALRIINPAAPGRGALLCSRSVRTDLSIEAGLHELVGMTSSQLEGMGSRGRALVAERFEWQKVADQMKAVYEWVTGGGPKPGFLLQP